MLLSFVILFGNRYAIFGVATRLFKGSLREKSFKFFSNLTNLFYDLKDLNLICKIPAREGTPKILSVRTMRYFA